MVRTLVLVTSLAFAATGQLALADIQYVGQTGTAANLGLTNTSAVVNFSSRSYRDTVNGTPPNYYMYTSMSGTLAFNVIGGTLDAQIPAGGNWDSFYGVVSANLKNLDTNQQRNFFGEGGATSGDLPIDAPAGRYLFSWSASGGTRVGTTGGNRGTVAMTFVPEPATLLAGVGVVGLALRRQRR